MVDYGSSAGPRRARLLAWLRELGRPATVREAHKLSGLYERQIWDTCYTDLRHLEKLGLAQHDSPSRGVPVQWWSVGNNESAKED